jgi:16S rRNA (cytosine967-C5)-methyltransferase
LKLGHSQQISPARRTAFSVLRQVGGGGYAADLLLEEAADLTSRDAGLASQLVFGCLRYQLQLDFLIGHFSRRNPDDLDEAVRILLRLGLFQLRYLDRIPAHAAVNEAVELAKKHRRGAAGLVNAVLRKVNRRAVRWPDEATELSCPAWLLDRWTRHFGREQARAIAQAALIEPAKYIRIAPGSEPPTGVTIEQTEVLGCFRVIGGASENLRFQDIGSQSVVPHLNLQGRQTLLDLCAPPGNKTIQALETPVRAVACDISFKRISEMPGICPRVVLNAAMPLPFRNRFDCVLIDAPCSGTGTLSRNPEIKWRVRPEDLLRLQKIQTAILKNGLEQLAGGGRLVYATCSLECEENKDVIRAAIENAPAGVKLASEHWRLPGRDPGDGFYVAVITSDKRTVTG